MKSYRIIAAAFAYLLAIAPVASGATVKGIARPYVGLMSPTADDYKDKVVFGLAAGCAFGNEDRHELTLDISRARWTYKASGSGWSSSASETWMPVLLNYRYYIPSGNEHFRFYINPAMGFTRYSLKTQADGFGLHVSDSDDPWAFTAALGCGATFELSPRISFDIGYRYLHISETDAELIGETIEGSSAKAHSFYAGLSVKF